MRSGPGRGRRRPVLLGSAGLLALLAVVAGCGSSGGSGSSDTGSASSSDASTRTLHLAFQYTDSSLDPAVWYGGLGTELESAIYESLVAYKPGTTTLVSQLAKSWTISSDGLTYTFKLQPHVTFHDGSAFNSAAVKFSWERELSIKSAPSYMLDDIASIRTPSALTLVVKMKKPQAAFLDYLASPWGPRIVSPTTVRAHEGKNQGQTYLVTHDAGTGPYELTSVKDNVGYTLKAYSGYWGTKPYYKKIDVSIVPSLTTEIVELEKGQIDALNYGLTAAQLQQLSGQSGLKIDKFPAANESYILLNPNVSALKDKAIRKAILESFDRGQLTKSVFGQYASVTSDFYPLGELPKGMAVDGTKYDPAALSKLSSRLKGKTLTVGYLNDGSEEGQLAELVVAELEAAGVSAKTRPYTDDEYYSLPEHPSQAPDIFTSAEGEGDTASPDAWLRAYLSTGGALNVLGISDKAGDAALATASTTVGTTAIDKAYAKAAQIYLNDDIVYKIADLYNPAVVRTSVIGSVERSVADNQGLLLYTARP